MQRAHGVIPRLFVPVCRRDAEARAGRGRLRGVSLLQARHPEGFDRARFDDCAEEGEWKSDDGIDGFCSVTHHFF